MRTQIVTARELDVVAAWWHTGSVKEAAKLLGMHEQTAKNLLSTARLRMGVPTTLLLARACEKHMPSVASLRRRTVKRRVA